MCLIGFPRPQSLTWRRHLVDMQRMACRSGGPRWKVGEFFTSNTDGACCRACKSYASHRADRRDLSFGTTEYGESSRSVLAQTTADLLRTTFRCPLVEAGGHIGLATVPIQSALARIKSIVDFAFANRETSNCMHSNSVLLMIGRCIVVEFSFGYSHGNTPS